MAIRLEKKNTAVFTTSSRGNMFVVDYEARKRSPPPFSCALLYRNGIGPMMPKVELPVTAIAPVRCVGVTKKRGRHLFQPHGGQNVVLPAQGSDENATPVYAFNSGPSSHASNLFNGASHFRGEGTGGRRYCLFSTQRHC